MPSQGIDNYRVGALVWTGEVAEIFRAIAPDGRLVALKRVRHGITARRLALRSLAREAEVGLMLDHPNLIDVVEYIDDPDVPIMVMEFFASRNAKVRRLAPRGDTLLDYHTKEILLQMAEGLNHMHERGIIHMDIKPENFLIGDDGTVKLTDFAIAELPVTGWRRHLPRRRRIAGTRSYIAPETIRRKAPDARTDIYSFGVTLYEILTHHAPFQSEDRDSLLGMHLRTPPAFMSYSNRNLTQAIDSLVLRMLEKDPSLRPQSMAEVIIRLKRCPIYKEEPVPPESEGPAR